MGRKEEKEERGSRRNRLRERRTRGRRKKEEEEYEGRKTKVFFRVNCFFFDTHSRSLVLKTLAYNHRWSWSANYSRFHCSSRDCSDNDQRLLIKRNIFFSKQFKKRFGSSSEFRVLRTREWWILQSNTWKYKVKAARLIIWHRKGFVKLVFSKNSLNNKPSQLFPV